MLLNRVFVLLTVFALSTFTIGCGGEEGGVADAPDAPPPELTPEEEAAEREYNRSVRNN